MYVIGLVIGSIFTTNHWFGRTIDDRLHKRFMGRHFEYFRTWTVGRGNDISHHSIRDLDPSSIATIYNNIFDAKNKVVNKEGKKKKN